MIFISNEYNRKRARTGPAVLVPHAERIRIIPGGRFARRRLPESRGQADRRHDGTRGIRRVDGSVGVVRLRQRIVGVEVGRPLPVVNLGLCGGSLPARHGDQGLG